ncbi:lysophospholipid acyltransferase family protein [Metabacillus sp. Hm71]|uniref:lysophospholipid acyltransferase family protein n=1 Tax=Metabacillus sp. Hm71 TaxID=3450743 RepID=UPI003F41B974
MKGSQYGKVFRFFQGLIRLVYPKYRIHIPFELNRPVVYVAHHQNLFGPFIILLWFPKCLRAWILHVFLDQEACYKQYVKYTFTKRFGWNKNVAKICALPLSFAITTFLKSGKGIPVYRGSRKIVHTFHQSVEALCKGDSIVIFPDIDYTDSSSRIKEMYDGYLLLDKYYYQATGEHVCFIPLYISKKEKLLIAGNEICFRDGEDVNQERKRVYQEISNTLNDLANEFGD